MHSYISVNANNAAVGPTVFHKRELHAWGRLSEDEASEGQQRLCSYEMHFVEIVIGTAALSRALWHVDSICFM